MAGLQNARSPARADYDWRGFARALRTALAVDGRGYRAIADSVGVTFTDLSRGAGGQMLSAGKVIALCDWMGTDPRAFYIAPTNSTCCSGSNVKHAELSR